jgi:hypothetical protein
MSHRNTQGRWLLGSAANNCPGVLLLVALAAPITAAAGSITYDAFAGSIGGSYDSPGTGNLVGNGAFGSGTNCSSSAAVNLSISTLSSNLSAPSGGVGPCSFFGGIVEHVGSTPQTAATGPVSGTFTSGHSNYGGAAMALAGSFANSSVALGVGAAGNLQGTFDGGTEASSVATAAIDDPNWKVSCPNCAPGETLFPSFTWSIVDVAVKTNLTGPNRGNFLLKLSSDLNNGGILVDWIVDYKNGGPGSEPNVTCPGEVAGCGFDIYPGGFSGAATFTFAPDSSAQAVTLGTGNSVNIDAQFALTSSVDSTGVIDPGAILTSVTWENAGGAPVSGVTLTTSTGVYADGGYTPFTTSTPEPASWLLCALGLGTAAFRRFRTVRL